MPVVVICTINWGREAIEKILPELKRHTEIVLQEKGCQEFGFAIDIENPDVVVATEIPHALDWKDKGSVFKLIEIGISCLETNFRPNIIERTAEVKNYRKF